MQGLQTSGDFYVADLSSPDPFHLQACQGQSFFFEQFYWKKKLNNIDTKYSTSPGITKNNTKIRGYKETIRSVNT